MIRLAPTLLLGLLPAPAGAVDLAGLLAEGARVVGHAEKGNSEWVYLQIGGALYACVFEIDAVAREVRSEADPCILVAGEVAGD